MLERLFRKRGVAEQGGNTNDKSTSHEDLTREIQSKPPIKKEVQKTETDYPTITIGTKTPGFEGGEPTVFRVIEKVIASFDGTYDARKELLVLEDTSDSDNMYVYDDGVYDDGDIEDTYVDRNFGPRVRKISKTDLSKLTEERGARSSNEGEGSMKKAA